jgi:hypothetical protein
VCAYVGRGYNQDAVVFVCAIKADGPLDSHKFSSGSLKGWHQIDLVEAKNRVDKIMEFQATAFICYFMYLPYPGKHFLQT